MNKADSDRDLPSPNDSLAEMRRLREENARLRDLLLAHSIRIPQTPSSTETTQLVRASLGSHSSGVGTAEQRIALFRGLFRGRDDVYAIRWENADGRFGYMPAADRDWKAYLSAKSEDRKKVDHRTRTFRPLKDEVIRRHLVGEHTVGIYPLMQDETCWLLAVDFDKKTWQKDATAFLAVCRALSVPAALERSRSGNGATSGYSLSGRFLRQLRAAWAVHFSLEPWSPDTKWDWIHMTDSFPTRTRCPGEDSAT